MNSKKREKVILKRFMPDAKSDSRLIILTTEECMGFVQCQDATPVPE